MRSHAIPRLLRTPKVLLVTLGAALLLACAGGAPTSETSAPATGVLAVEELFLPTQTYTMMGPGEEAEFRILARQPVKVLVKEGRTLLYNLSPATYQDVQVSDAKGILATGLKLAPWTRTTLAAPSTGEVEVRIPEATNPVMAKFAQISVAWGWQPHNFDPNDDKSNWKHEVTGLQLRGFYTLNYNMAHFISTPAFEEEILGHAILVDNATAYPDNAAIVTAMRTSTKVFNNWIVDGGPSGLGGGTTLGLGINQPVRHIDPALWANGGMYTLAWFHEFAHCFGFSHASNMTYGQDAAHPEIPALIQARMVKEWKERDGLLFPALKSPAAP